MTVVVREKYPVEELPEDLRKAVAGAKTVRITIQTETPPMTIDDIFAEVERIRSQPGFKPRSTEEIVAEIRALRDEWD